MNERAQSYLDFAVKVFIVALAVFLVSYAPLIPIFRIFDNVSEVMVRVNNLSERFEEAMGEPMVRDNLKMRLYGLTINPATLYQTYRDKVKNVPAAKFPKVAEIEKILLPY